MSSMLRAVFDSLRAQGRKALITYITAGDPSIAATPALMSAMARGGADIVELGVPFSDPLADGKTIQRASERALANGTNLKHVLEAVAAYRKEAKSASVPVVLLLYYNTILASGIEEFVRSAASAGVAGLVVPDLPPEEAGPLRAACVPAGMSLICLLAPTSPDRRICLVSQLAEGFIYCISVNGVTGGTIGMTDGLQPVLENIKRYTDVPLAVGFGISTPDDARTVARMADGVIVGSAIIRRMEEVLASGGTAVDASNAVREFVERLRNAIDQPDARAI